MACMKFPQSGLFNLVWYILQFRTIPILSLDHIEGDQKKLQLIEASTATIPVPFCDATPSNSIPSATRAPNSRALNPVNQRPHKSI